MARRVDLSKLALEELEEEFLQSSEYRAKRIVAAMLDKGPQAIHSLVRCLKVGGHGRRKIACDGLAVFGEKSIPVLLDAMVDEDPAVRWRTYNTLARIGGPAANHIILALRDSDSEEMARILAAASSDLIWAGRAAPVLDTSVVDFLLNHVNDVDRETETLCYNLLLQCWRQTLESLSSVVADDCQPNSRRIECLRVLRNVLAVAVRDGYSVLESEGICRRLYPLITQLAPLAFVPALWHNTDGQLASELYGLLLDLGCRAVPAIVPMVGSGVAHTMERQDVAHELNEFTLVNLGLEDEQIVLPDPTPEEEVTAAKDWIEKMNQEALRLPDRMEEPPRSEDRMDCVELWDILCGSLVYGSASGPMFLNVGQDYDGPTKPYDELFDSLPPFTSDQVRRILLGLSYTSYSSETELARETPLSQEQNNIFADAYNNMAVRHKSAGILERHGLSMLPQIAGLLHESNHDLVVAGALESLLLIDGCNESALEANPELVSGLLRFVGMPSDQWRPRALAAVLHIGALLIDQLAERASSGQLMARIAAVVALARLGPAARGVIAAHAVESLQCVSVLARWVIQQMDEDRLRSEQSEPLDAP